MTARIRSAASFVTGFSEFADCDGSARPGSAITRDRAYSVECHRVIRFATAGTERSRPTVRRRQWTNHAWPSPRPSLMNKSAPG